MGCAPAFPTEHEQDVNVGLKGLGFACGFGFELRGSGPKPRNPCPLTQDMIHASSLPGKVPHQVLPLDVPQCTINLLNPRFVSLKPEP